MANIGDARIKPPPEPKSNGGYRMIFDPFEDETKTKLDSRSDHSTEQGQRVCVWSKLLKKSIDFFDKSLLQHFDFERFLIVRTIPFERKAH